MFTRIKRVKNSQGKVREYLLLVESQRVKGKIRQRTIANLGRVDLYDQTEAADILIEKLQEYTKTKQLMDMAKSQCDWSKEYGIVGIVRRLWRDLGLDKFFHEYLSKYNYQVNYKECLLAMVTARFMNKPCSECETERWMSEVYEPQWEGLERHHFYRALDFLYAHKADLEKDLFTKTTDLFSQKLDLIMFDTTTIKYWGEGDDAKNLLRYGRSKEKRNDLKQMIVGVLMTKEGYPVGCETLPGNAADVKSFINVVKKIQTRFQIGKLIWVCDRGMISKNNLKELNELKQEYILGVKMRQFDKDKKEKLLNLRGIKEVRKNLYVKEVYIEGEGRYIVCYNPFEAKRQREKRKVFKRYLRKKVNTATLKEWVIKNGYKKYVNFEGSVSVNEQKIKDESQYDGKWILLTNTTLPQKEVALQYKGLWEIEAGFRDLKQDLDTSPIYHWKERRIIAHVFVCFLALLIKIAFEKKLRALDPKVDYVDVWQAVKQIKAVKLSSGPQEIIFRSEFPDKAYLAFKALSLAPPPRILHYKKKKCSVPSKGDRISIDEKCLF